MSKKVTVYIYDCCLPDYFGGHHKPVLQYPVDGATTRENLYNGLLYELSTGVIDYEIDNNQLDHEAIKQAIKKCIFWNIECNNDDLVFPDLEIEPEYCDLQCYAFFIVDWSDEE